MPADRTPSVLITDIHGPLGAHLAYRFAKEHWFIMGCDSSHEVAKYTKAQIAVDEGDPDDCQRAVARAALLGNGLDCVIECDPDSLIGSAAVPVVAEMDGCVVEVYEFRERFADHEKLAEEAFLRALAHIHVVA